jgi:hypothetical protein
MVGKLNIYVASFFFNGRTLTLCFSKYWCDEKPHELFITIKLFVTFP